MDIRQLQFLVAIGDHGTIGRAARHLGVTQSALSQSLARLETQLEVTLFDRTKRGMVATPYGLALMQRARNISYETQRALEDLDRLRGLGRGSLVVAGGPAVVNTIVPEAVRRLLITRPNLRVRIREGSIDALAPLLEQGEVNLAVLTRDALGTERQLVSEPLLHDAVQLIVRTQHPLRQRSDASLEDCLEFPWVLPAPPDTLRKMAESFFMQKGLRPPTVAIETSSALAIKSLLVNSDYVSFLPRRLIALEEKGGLLAPLNLPESIWHREVHILYPQRKVLSTTERRLIAELRNLEK